MGPIEKLKEIWRGKLSSDGQHSIRNNALLLAGGIAASLIMATVGLSSFLVVGVAAVSMGIAGGNVFGTDNPVRSDLRDNKDTREWQTGAGQIVQGSSMQFKKMAEAQKDITGLFSSVSKPPARAVDKIRNRFSSAAAGIRVIEDVPNGNGKLVYATGQEFIPAVA